MKIKKILLIPVLAVLVSFFSFTPAFAQTNPLLGKIIILDPGHGGSDPGAVNVNLREADVALDIAQRLEPLLEADGAIVYLTRDCDCAKTNEDRYTFANSHNGNVLVSIHLNGSTNLSKDGTQGLYGQKNKDIDFTKVIHQALYPSLSVPDLGVTNFASGVLIKSSMPATIAETVFITNSNEYNSLTDGTGNRQLQIAQSLYQGLVNWFNEPPTPPKGKKP